jgi:phosphoribosylanthranilate isomerase
MSIAIKICGLSTPDTMEVALDAGADMVGLVFHPKSPRYVTLDQAEDLAHLAHKRAETVALLVDPDDELIAQIILRVRPGRLQLHGKESPGRIAEIQNTFFIPVMKAIGVAAAADLAAIADYAAAESILLDAKPPKDAAYPGGHGRVFDWSILSALSPSQPFLLSGGLTPENVGEAIRSVRGFGLQFSGVDVSSGVESAPGVKDTHKIRDFINAARHAGD